MKTSRHVQIHVIMTTDVFSVGVFGTRGQSLNLRGLWFRDLMSRVAEIQDRQSAKSFKSVHLFSLLPQACQSPPTYHKWHVIHIINNNELRVS